MLSLKDQWCWYHVSTRPAASLSRDPDDLQMHWAVNPLHLGMLELAARFLMRAPAFLNVSGNCGSPTSQDEPFSMLVKRSFSCQRCPVTFLCRAWLLSFVCSPWAVREAEFGCPAWRLGLIRPGGSKLTPTVTLTRLGPNSKFTRCFNPKSFHVCVLDFIPTRSKGKIRSMYVLKFTDVLNDKACCQTSACIIHCRLAW